MASLTPGPLVSSIRGRVGGVNFRQQSGQSTAQIHHYRPVPRPRAISPQLADWYAPLSPARHALGAAHEIWAGLSEEQRVAWRHWDPRGRGYQLLTAREIVLGASGFRAPFAQPSTDAAPTCTGVTTFAGPLLAGIDSISASAPSSLTVQTTAQMRGIPGQRWGRGFKHSSAFAHNFSAFFDGIQRSLRSVPLVTDIYNLASANPTSLTTFEMWFYPLSRTGDQVLWRKLPDVGGIISANLTGLLTWFMLGPDTPLGVALPLNRWSQIIVRTNNITQIATVAINGQILPFTIPITSDPYENAFNLAGVSPAATLKFDGLVGRFTIWHQYFSDTNVLICYNGGLGVPAVVFSSLYNSWRFTNPTLSPDDGDVPGNSAVTKIGLTADLGPFALLHYKSSDWGPPQGSWNWSVGLADDSSPFVITFRGRSAFN